MKLNLWINSLLKKFDKDIHTYNNLVLLNNSRITSAPRWPRRLRIRNPPLRPTTCSVVWMNLILFYFNHKMIEKVTLFRFTPFQIFLKQRFRKFTL